MVKLRLQLCHRACRFDLREWIYSLFSLTLPAAVGTLEVSTQVSKISTPVCGMVALRGDLPVLVGDGRRTSSRVPCGECRELALPDLKNYFVRAFYDLKPS